MNVDERGAGGPPHGLLLAAVAAVVVAAPFLLGDSGQAIVDAIPELLSPAGLLLLPLALILLIRFLSSDRGTALADVFFSPGTGPGPDSIHRVGGSPVGVALALLLIVVLLYYRISIFGDDDSGD